MDIGRLGCWTWLDGMPAAEAAAFARRLEAWGYGALWIPEAVGRDPFSLIGYLAAGFVEQPEMEGATGHHGCDRFFSKAL